MKVFAQFFGTFIRIVCEEATRMIIEKFLTFVIHLELDYETMSNASISTEIEQSGSIYGL